MVITEKNYIEDEIIKNLLSTHEKMAGTGDPKQVIKLSNYILKLAEKRKDKLLDLGAEKDEKCPKEPPDEST